MGGAAKFLLCKLSWFLYTLEYSAGTFYTGITTALDRRCAEHNRGIASRYTRSRLPVTLFYHEPCQDRSHASRREYEVKALSRAEKQRLIWGV